MERIQRLQLTPVWQYLLGTSCHTSPTENYSETALPDSRIIEKPALTFPRSLYSATSFSSLLLGLFYRLLSWYQGFHCNIVNFFAPAFKPRSSWGQILHNLKPNSTLREDHFLFLQFSSQLSPFILLPKSLCLCWKRSLQCSVFTSVLTTFHLLCHFKHSQEGPLSF